MLYDIPLTFLSDVSSILYDSNDIHPTMPTFMSEVDNKTVIAGRTAILKCSVKNLGNYKVSRKRNTLK